MRDRVDREATRIRRDEREAGAGERNNGVSFPAMILHLRRSRDDNGVGSDKLPIGFCSGVVSGQ
ncbi:hypothetical protein Hanom_Chr11g01010701 [Helianthus anomalus]